MAVYKSTRCYPFLNSIDIRVTQKDGSEEIPVQYLKCKVETSNKNITGYSVRLLDENNMQIFPGIGEGYASPITELQEGNMSDVYQPNGDNSGLNGTYLYIPFFQNRKKPMTDSINAIYYNFKFSVGHLILTDTLLQFYNEVTGQTVTLNGGNLAKHWLVDASTGNLCFDWSKAGPQDNKVKNRIMLDGECLLENEIVLFTSDEDGRGATVTPGFYKAIKQQVIDPETGESFNTTQLQRISEGEWSSETFTVVIEKGETFHNTHWERRHNASGYEIIFLDASQNIVNYFYERNYNEIGFISIPSLNNSANNFSLYKWEVTLYQGEGKIKNVGPYDTIKYIDYSELKNEAYDMPVSYGTILGSNSSRIQIASGQAFDEQGGIDKNSILPGLNEGTLVLQGTYMAMASSEEEGIFPNNRIYVQSYDSSLGHVYPITGDLEASRVTSCDKVQFFKYSNNPDDIKATDTVEYGTGYSVVFYLCSSENPSIDLNLTDFNSLEINKRRYGLNKIDLPPFLQELEGGKILLTGQVGNGMGDSHTAAYQNGVYQIYKDDSLGVEGVLWLKRAASYDKWADYLGKIIYCPNFFDLRTAAPSSLNKESLAGSGTFTLWDPDSAISGDSNLYFSNEKPILLFENKLNPYYSFDLQWDGYNYDFSAGERVPFMIDGIATQEGFIVVGPGPEDGTISVLKIEKVNNELRFVAYDYSPSASDYYYVSQGRQYGKMVFKGEDSSSSEVGIFTNTPNWDLYTAQILKNSTNYTYITPFLNIKKNMRMKLSGGNTVLMYIQDAVDLLWKETEWIPINNTNETLYCVYHPKLKTELESEISEDYGTPWKYQIRSFFKTSDENPFYVCELPYLVLYKNNAPYSSLSNINVFQEYWVTDAIFEQFRVRDNEDNVVFCFSSYGDGSYIYDRAIKLSADYIQFSGLSWESYRWCLFNSKGKMLQDTGKKYDKSIAVIFYGLSSDSSESQSVYYAVLQVEDEKQNILFYIIKLEVKTPATEFNNSSFRATFECESCAVKLEYNGAEFSEEDKATVYRREYEVYQYPGLKIYGYYDKNTESFYSNYSGGQYMNLITPKQGIVYVDKLTKYYYKYDFNNENYIMTPRARVYKGEWEPVILKTSLKSLYDYNIESGKSYQYVVYPKDEIDFDVKEERTDLNKVFQIFANGTSEFAVWHEDNEYAEQGQGKIIKGSFEETTFNGAPISVNWDMWSICELIPKETDDITPSVKKVYEVNTDQMWFFKYSLDTGSQTQNISRKDINTLGTYPKIGFGNLNYASGQVTALLGSELVLSSKTKYIERLKKSRLEPLSTNEKIEMLQAWRDFVYSKNPKLLRDIKGQSWIVQIMSSSNTPKNFYSNQPDTISFQWKQIEDTKYSSIYSNVDELEEEAKEYGSALWEPVFGVNKNI